MGNKDSVNACTNHGLFVPTTDKCLGVQCYLETVRCHTSHSAREMFPVRDILRYGDEK